MTRKEKLIDRFWKQPYDFRWEELVVLLCHLGYRTYKSGKTGGSRQRFVHERYPPIVVHKPHPGNILKEYQMKHVRNFLEEQGLL